jgi:capsular exopolysaccharide synthesis family protein
VELRDYLRVLSKRWRIVAIVTALGLSIGVLASLSAPQYVASAQIFVGSRVTDDASQLFQANLFSSARVQSYTSIATSPDVMDAVVSNLSLDITGEQLSHKVSADAPQNKVLINVHVRDGNAQRAKEIADETARVLSKRVELLETTDSSKAPPVKLTLTHEADIPTSPDSPKPVRNIALALLVSLLFGGALALVRESLDSTIKSSDLLTDVSGAPVLGVVIKDVAAVKMPVALRSAPTGGRAEAFRKLRTNLQFVEVAKSSQSIAVTSAAPGEGKTSTAINLAAALAESGFRTILVDADLRRPMVAATLGLVPSVGFTSVLIGKVALADALQQAGPNLMVLTAGPIPPNPSELLGSEQTENLMNELVQIADYVVVDTAPLLPVADGAIAAATVDGTILVTHWGRTTRDQVRRSVESLNKVGAPLIGSVLNMHPVSRRSDADYYSYSYGYSTANKSRWRFGRKKDDQAGPDGGADKAEALRSERSLSKAEAKAAAKESKAAARAAAKAQAALDRGMDEPYRARRAAGEDDITPRNRPASKTV